MGILESYRNLRIVNRRLITLRTTESNQIKELIEYLIPGLLKQFQPVKPSQPGLGTLFISTLAILRLGAGIFIKLSCRAILINRLF